MRLGHHIITMQQSEDNGTERAVLTENSFKDEFDEKFGKDKGDRRPAHVDQPQIISDDVAYRSTRPAQLVDAASRALGTVHVIVSTYGENEDEEESIVILATSI